MRGDRQDEQDGGRRDVGQERSGDRRRIDSGAPPSPKPSGIAEPPAEVPRDAPSGAHRREGRDEGLEPPARDDESVDRAAERAGAEDEEHRGAEPEPGFHESTTR